MLRYFCPSANTNMNMKIAFLLLLSLSITNFAIATGKDIAYKQYGQETKKINAILEEYRKKSKIEEMVGNTGISTKDPTAELKTKISKIYMSKYLKKPIKPKNVCYDIGISFQKPNDGFKNPLNSAKTNLKIQKLMLKYTTQYYSKLSGNK